MTREQKELLYKITCLHSSQFYLAMNDHWDAQDYTKDGEYTREINKLENEYKSTYGDLPNWNGLINNVWETQAELKRELGK